MKVTRCLVVHVFVVMGELVEWCRSVKVALHFVVTVASVTVSCVMALGCWFGSVVAVLRDVYVAVASRQPTAVMMLAMTVVLMGEWGSSFWVSELVMSYVVLTMLVRVGRLAV